MQTRLTYSKKVFLLSVHLLEFRYIGSFLLNLTGRLFLSRGNGEFSREVYFWLDLFEIRDSGAFLLILQKESFSLQLTFSKQINLTGRLFLSLGNGA